MHLDSLNNEPAMWTLSHSAEFFAPLGAAALICAGLITVLRPVLVRYALARPNARSSHRQPTPQGGGIAVVGATMTILIVTGLFAPASLPETFTLATLFLSVAALALVGIADDIRPLEVWPRLLLQSIAVIMTLVSLPSTLQVFPALPWLLERALMFVGLLWFINLVNFMDGIDWITVAEIVPITAALALFGFQGALPPEATLIALTLCGAMIGFAPFNRPIAQLFLGDVGSLPIGLLLGWLLVLLAGKHFVAALLLPLYYIADATITLLRRLIEGESLLKAHRSHFYQRAMDNGFSVTQIVARIFVLNLALIGLATLTLFSSSRLLYFTYLLAGCAMVAGLLMTFARKRNEPVKS